jgi:hypothetical protein|tara:strand:+ start:117 stop:359 length:243 start_codon:yes stop_codon:yes gene_type:complete
MIDDLIKQAPNLFCYDNMGGDDPHAVQLKVDLSLFDSLPTGPSESAVMVTDSITGDQFIVSRAACGSGCYCAAIARRVTA